MVNTETGLRMALNLMTVLAAAVCVSLNCATSAARKPLKVAFVGDPQVNDSTEMRYARESVYSELAGRKDIDLGIFLGDLVNDNTSLLDESVRIIGSLPFPCLMIPGNHDRDVYRDCQSGKIRDLASWNRTVGYTDTAFTVGHTRFILMNNVRHRGGGTSDYEGGFTESQKHWLDSALNVRSRLTVLATHIPFSLMKGQDSVLALIPDTSKMLLVSGHTHSVARSRTAAGNEIIAGAACGSWWRGVKDANGIPCALQNCGAPRGYFTADIRKNGKYSLDYKCIGRSADEQLSVWAEKVDSLTFSLYVNVFGGSQDGTVKIRIPGHGGKPLTCGRCDWTAPEVQKVIEANASASRGYRREHRDEFIPLRRKNSPHLWKSEAADFSGSGVPEYVSVRYSDGAMKIHCRRIVVNFQKTY